MFRGKPDAVLLDMRRMNRIDELSVEDMYIVAESGVTREQLYLAASEQGVRTPYRGPLSGRFATVGRTLSNNSVFFGSTRYGTVAESVLGVEAVLADGRTLRTGSWAHRQGTPFMRHYGPALTRLLLAETGAMGIQARASLRLVQLPAASVGLAFSVPDFDASNALLLEIARTELAAEAYGFDQTYNGVFAELGFAYLRDVQWTIFCVVDRADEAVARGCGERRARDRPALRRGDRSERADGCAGRSVRRRAVGAARAEGRDLDADPRHLPAVQNEDGRRRVRTLPGGERRGGRAP